MTVSCGPSGAVPTEAISPSRTDTSPVPIDRPSAMAMMVALRIRSDATVALRTGDVQPLHRHGCRVDAATNGDELRHDADGDLGGRNRTDVEADGGMYPRQALGRHALLEEPREYPADLRPAADQAEISKVARGQRPHRVQVVSVAAGHDHHEGRRGELGAVEPVGDRLGDDFFRAGKALRARELLAIVDDVYAEPRIDREPAEMP